MYLDSAYIAKMYLLEPDSKRVRDAVAAAETRVSSMWAVAEVASTLHRHVREGALPVDGQREIMQRFLDHVGSGVWRLHPVSDRLLKRMAERMLSIPGSVFLRSGDALHLTTASELGEKEIWSGDRHLLAAAPYFGIEGRTV